MDVSKNNGKNKAIYELNSFIDSEIRYEFDLKPYHIVVLYVVARYLDMPEGRCFLSQKVLAKQCGMSVSELYRSVQYLVKNELLLKYQSGKNTCYELGSAILSK